MESKEVMKRKKALSKAWEAAKREYRYFSTDELSKMAGSREANNRLFALLLMRKQIEEGDSPEDYFGLARRLVEDSDNNCRWQSLIVIGESIESEAERVWEVVSEFGDSEDSDMRTAVATVLLEHLLDYDFKSYFLKVKKEIQQGRRRFIETLEQCCFDSNCGPNYKKVQRFLRNARRGLGNADDEEKQ